jgi:hypothetical protein
MTKEEALQHLEAEYDRAKYIEETALQGAAKILSPEEIRASFMMNKK